jgi:hypothetical protein
MFGGRVRPGVEGLDDIERFGGDALERPSNTGNGDNSMASQAAFRKHQADQASITGVVPDREDSGWRDGHHQAECDLLER